jgi:hypothetical protein
LFSLLLFFLVSAIQEAVGVFSVGALDICLANIFIFCSIPVAASVTVVAVLRIVIFWFPLIVGCGIAHAIDIRGLLNSR